MDNASALRKLESPTCGEAALARLELARALLRRGRTVAAIRCIQQAMPQHPAAAAAVMAEARSHIHAIRGVIQRASRSRLG